MGSIFEAFVFCGDFEEIADFLEQREDIFNFEKNLSEIEDDISVVYVYTPETLEPEIVENIAKEICKNFDKCLYVYWNSEENTSYAMLYNQEVGFVDAFGEDDEIWVELGEGSRANLKGPRFTRQQTLENQDPEKSYICILSCLDAALLNFKADITVRGQALVALEDVLEDESDDDLDEEDEEDEGDEEKIYF